MDYKSAGVDIDSAGALVARVRDLARSTYTGGVLSDIGAFGGVFRPDLAGLGDPVLVASADGVGTKLKVAFAAGRHDTVGIDLVNHCVNDVLVQGARPLFFLDYLATGVLSPDVSAAVIAGVAEGCRANDCALLGGETAEMPGMYAAGEYDLAGFVVGLADRQRLVDGRRIVPGDVLIGLPSSGLHTNGYSLARRILFETLGLGVEAGLDELGCTVGDELLRIHRSYLRAVWPAVEAGLVKGLAHITGGGLTDNVPRILPPGCTTHIDRAAWRVPPIFTFLQARGDVPTGDMYRTFNMGIGMVIVCDRAAEPELLAALAGAGEAEAVRIGAVRPGEPGVAYGGAGGRP